MKITRLSVNLNKIALIRNSRGRNYPDVVAFARRFMDLGAAGVTLHPRPDQRHARYADAFELKKVCDELGKELNLEGYPTREFLDVVLAVKPAQCTLVPDAPNQLTSDHGWDLVAEGEFLRGVTAELNAADVRVSLFVDYDCPNIALARELGAARVELYTEPYAQTFGMAENDAILAGFITAAHTARGAGLGVNAGHDLNLDNLARFLAVPNVLEVSIGHALIVECLELGMVEVMRRYGEILAQKQQPQPQP